MRDKQETSIMGYTGRIRVHDGTDMYTSCTPRLLSSIGPSVRQAGSVYVVKVYSVEKLSLQTINIMLNSRKHSGASLNILCGYQLKLSLKNIYDITVIVILPEHKVLKLLFYF